MTTSFVVLPSIYKTSAASSGRLKHTIKYTNDLRKTSHQSKKIAIIKECTNLDRPTSPYFQTNHVEQHILLLAGISCAGPGIMIFLPPARDAELPLP